MHTFNSLASLLQQPVHRVTRAIKVNEIQPIGRSGRTLLFDDSVIPLVAAALRRATRRGGGNRRGKGLVVAPQSGWPAQCVPRGEEPLKGVMDQKFYNTL
jgi:hypothetical protein